MISELFATDQIIRLAGLRFFPPQFEAQRELVCALREVATDEADAENLMTCWIRNNEVCPTPAHFYRLIDGDPGYYEVPEL